MSKYNGNKKFKRPQEKFQTNFKKKIPFWQQIDTELTELLPQYDQVHLREIIYLF